MDSHRRLRVNRFIQATMRKLPFLLTHSAPSPPQEEIKHRPLRVQHMTEFILKHLIPLSFLRPIPFLPRPHYLLQLQPTPRVPPPHNLPREATPVHTAEERRAREDFEIDYCCLVGC